MFGSTLDFIQIIIADLVLSGDNALIIGMAAASLSPELRKKAIFYGMVLAAVLRIVFAVIATTLLGIPGLLFVGSLLLFWVCWRLYNDIREHTAANTAMLAEGLDADGSIPSGGEKKSLRSALISIAVADISMSLDNVLAVAGIADGNTNLLIFGLGLAILLMAFAATLIMKLLVKYPWISWLGLVVLLYVAGEMFFHGLPDVLAMLGMGGEHELIGDPD